MAQDKISGEDSGADREQQGGKRRGAQGGPCGVEPDQCRRMGKAHGRGAGHQAGLAAM